MTETEKAEALQQKRETRSSLATRAFIVLAAMLLAPMPIVTWQVLLIANDASDSVEKIEDQNAVITEQAATIKELTEQIADTQQSSQSLLDLITSCTDPDGKCAKESQAAAAANRGAINAANWLALYCRDQILPEVWTYRELIGCVGRRLDELSEGGSP